MLKRVCKLNGEVEVDVVCVYVFSSSSIKWKGSWTTDHRPWGPFWWNMGKECFNSLWFLIRWFCKFVLFGLSILFSALCAWPETPQQSQAKGLPTDSLVRSLERGNTSLYPTGAAVISTVILVWIAFFEISFFLKKITVIIIWYIWDKMVIVKINM